MVPGIEQRQLVVRDGTRIGYQLRAGDRRDAPAVVLANGLGGTFEAYRHLYAALDGYRTLCWDYRGLYASGPAAVAGADTVEHQVADLLELLDHEGIRRAVVVGWSMGVQVALQTVRAAPDRVAGLLLINGTAGRPFATVASSRLVQKVIPSLLQVMKWQAALVGRGARLVAGSDALVDAMQTFGLVSPTLDRAAFRDVAAGFKTIDWRIYADLLRRLDEHDASDVLGALAVPCTIVTGDRDLMTPPDTAERMHRAVPGSRLVVIPGGTHYTPVEYPDVLGAELARLLAAVPGWAPADRGSAVSAVAS
jgi:pimeloyl-ACP methyl ester carboxylesterase